MPGVERPRGLVEPVIGWARSLNSVLDAASHRLSPLLPLGLRHPRRNEKLQDAGAEAGRDRPPTLAGGDYPDRWPKLARVVFQDVVLPSMQKLGCRDCREVWAEPGTQGVNGLGRALPLGL